jgi:hypothetical protein
VKRERFLSRKQLQDNSEKEVEKRRLAMEIVQTFKQVSAQQLWVDKLPVIVQRLYIEPHPQDEINYSGQNEGNYDIRQRGYPGSFAFSVAVSFSRHSEASFG